jgi:hypothetical protein
MHAVRRNPMRIRYVRQAGTCCPPFGHNYHTRTILYMHIYTKLQRAYRHIHKYTCIYMQTHTRRHTYTPVFSRKTPPINIWLFENIDTKDPNKNSKIIRLSKDFISFLCSDIAYDTNDCNRHAASWGARVLERRNFMQSWLEYMWSLPHPLRGEEGVEQDKAGITPSASVYECTCVCTSITG